VEDSLSKYAALCKKFVLIKEILKIVGLHEDSKVRRLTEPTEKYHMQQNHSRCRFSSPDFVCTRILLGLGKRNAKALSRLCLCASSFQVESLAHLSAAFTFFYCKILST
jgi:hypothetical protein